MADKKKMSVEDILAACRESAGGETHSAPPEPAADKTPEATPPSAHSAAEGGQDVPEPGQAKAGTSSGKPASEMSLADILAAARGQSGGSKPTPPARAAPKSSGVKSTVRKGKATSSSGKATESRQQPSVTGGHLPLDTSSILSAARGGAKPGPISKAEAEARGQVIEVPVKPIRSISAPPMPSKPAYAQPQLAPAAIPHRRGFFSILLGSSLAVGFTTLSVTGLFWLFGLARYLFPNILIEPPSRFKVGFPGDFAPGMVDTKFKAQFGVWIVNTNYEGQREIVALKTVCTHLGCTPNWLEAEQKFKCPCHGSGFYKDGVNFEGPAPRPLERYAIRVADDGQLEIDKSKTFQRELGQWVDPACYVLA